MAVNLTQSAASSMKKIALENPWLIEFIDFPSEKCESLFSYKNFTFKSILTFDHYGSTGQQWWHLSIQSETSLPEEILNEIKDLFFKESSPVREIVEPNSDLFFRSFVQLVSGKKFNVEEGKWF